MENSLFNQPEPWTAGNESLYYVTNQLNLREIINGGFIGSVFSFDNKYYEDLLNIAPGYIPFLNASMISSASKKVSVMKTAHLHPVVLELDAKDLKKGADHIYSHSDEPRHILCVVLSRPVSMCEIKAIHFISAEDLEETRLREWGEIIQPLDLYHLSPQLFNSVDDSTKLYEWLSSLPPVNYPSKNDFMLFDRMAGAVALCSFQKEFGLSLTEDLTLLMKPSVQKHTVTLPKWLAEGIHPSTFSLGKRNVDEERALFTAALSVLYRQNLDTVGTSIDIALETGRQIENMKLSPDKTLSIKKNLERMRAYIRNERDLVPSPAKPGFEVSKALTLFLMRWEYDELIHWSPEETGATEAVMMTALAFAGAAAGFKNISSQYRTTTTDELISQRMISAMFDVKKQKKAAEKVKVVMPPDQEFPVVGIELPTAVSHGLSPIATFDPNSKQYNLLAGELCRYMNWNDCVTTRIRISGSPATITNAAGNYTEISIGGVAEIIYDIDAGKFSKYMSECDPVALSIFQNFNFPKEN